MNSLCGSVAGSVASLEPWDLDLIPSLAQRVKDWALLQLWRRSQLQLGSDPWPGNSTCHGVAKNEEKKSLKNISKNTGHTNLFIYCYGTVIKYTVFSHFLTHSARRSWPWISGLKILLRLGCLYVSTLSVFCFVLFHSVLCF